MDTESNNQNIIKEETVTDNEGAPPATTNTVIDELGLVSIPPLPSSNIELPDATQNLLVPLPIDTADDQELVDATATIQPDLSDHFPCILTVTDFNQSNTNQTKIIERKLNKKNLDKIKNDIGNIDWDIELNNLDTNESFENLHNKLKEIIDLHAPERLIYLKEKRINKPWISKNLANCIRKSKILFKNSLMNPGTKSHYTDYSKILKQTTRIAKLNYYKSLCKDFKSNTKKLWAMVNNQIKKTDNKTSIITKLVSNNKEYTNSKNIGDVLAKHIATVGKTYASKIKPSKKSLNHYCNKIPLNNKSLYFNPTSELEINKIINKLENKNSYGYD